MSWATSLSSTLQWMSLDGVMHEADIDIGAIFKDGVVLHRVPESEVAEGLFPQGLVGHPSVYLEVNDRTIRVFMSAFIPTKEPQIPGNPHSSARTDVIEAWSHTY